MNNQNNQNQQPSLDMNQPESTLSQTNPPKNKWPVIIVLAILALGVGVWAVMSLRGNVTVPEEPIIIAPTNFTECVEAGGEVMESYPEQCAYEDQIFINEDALVACTMDAMECPDGSFVGRVPPTCEFAACPVDSADRDGVEEQVAVDEDVPLQPPPISPIPPTPVTEQIYRWSSPPDFPLYDFYQFSYPSNWSVIKLADDSGVEVVPPSNWGLSAGKIVIKWMDFKKGCNFRLCFMSGFNPLVYTDSADQRVVDQFNKLVAGVSVEDQGEVFKAHYQPYVNLGRGFDIEQFMFFGLLFYEPFLTASHWTGSQAELTINADPEDATNKVVRIKTTSDASFFKDIDWPKDTMEVTYDYFFPESTGDGTLTVHLYDPVTGQPEGESQIVDFAWSGGLSGEWESGVFAIGKDAWGRDFAGKNARLNFVLRSDNGEEVSVLIDNIAFWGLVR